MTAEVYYPRILLVTGSAGFIGAHFVEYALAHDPGIRVIAFDALTYAGRRESLSDAERAHPERFTFVKGDIRDRAVVATAFAEHQPDTVVHFAAESHVDRSIDQPLEFVETNVMGTGVLLAAARSDWGGRTDVRFHHISTD